MLKKEPEPGVGYRLLRLGDNLHGSQLWLGSLWDQDPQNSHFYEYNHEMRDAGLFYRVKTEDPDKAFENWAGGLMLTPEQCQPEAVMRMAWHAAREYYQTK